MSLSTAVKSVTHLAAFQREGNLIPLFFPLPRSDLLKKTHGKHRLAEILRSEYSSGMDTGVSKVKKKKKQRKPGNQQIPT